MPPERLTAAYKSLLEYQPPTISQLKADPDLCEPAKQEFWRIASDFAIGLVKESPGKIRILEKRITTVMAVYKPGSQFRKALKNFQELLTRLRLRPTRHTLASGQ